MTNGTTSSTRAWFDDLSFDEALTKMRSELGRPIKKDPGLQG